MLMKNQQSSPSSEIYSPHFEIFGVPYFHAASAALFLVVHPRLRDTGVPSESGTGAFL